MRIYSNIAAPTTLAGAIGAADTSLTLADATGYPAPGAGESALLQVEAELLEYTSLVGAVVSGITRGVDGTTAVAHADGVEAAHVASARDVEAAQALRAADGTALVVGAVEDKGLLARSGTGLVSVPRPTDYIRPSQYYTVDGAPIAQRSFGLNAVYTIDLDVDPDRPLDRIGLDITGVASGTIRFGLWLPDAAGGLPGTLLFDSDELDASVSAFVEAVCSVSPTGYSHVIAGMVRHGATGLAAGVQMARRRMSMDSPATSATFGTYFRLGITGALPNPFGTPGGLTSGAPLINLRAA